MSLADFDRVPLTFGPSPVHPLRRLTEHLGGAVDIWMKREDCNSGLAYGGNKVRKLEYVAADALAQTIASLPQPMAEMVLAAGLGAPAQHGTHPAQGREQHGTPSSKGRAHLATRRTEQIQAPRPVHARGHRSRAPRPSRAISLACFGPRVPAGVGCG